MTHISWREVPLLIRCVPAAAKMPWVRLRCLLFNCLPSCSFRICLKCTDEAMDEILYCYEMWQCNDQIHAIEVWNHCILNWIQIEMDIFCPCRSDVFVVVLLHIHPPLHPVFGLRTYFFPVVKLSPKEELLKTDLQKEMSRHLKVFCTAIASSEINCGTCIYPCCVLYLFCSTSAFSQFVQYIFGFLWQIFCVWSHHSHHLGSILCISQLHPPAAYIAGLVLFRFYGPMFCCLFVLGSFL